MNFINKEELDKYIKSNSKYNDIIIDIIANLEYLAKDEIIKGTISFISSLNKNKKIYILLDDAKIGSQHWLYYYYKDYIGEHEIISSHDIIEDNSVILVIDDVIIGGGFVSNLIHDFIINNKNIVHNNVDIIIYSYAKNKDVDINSKHVKWGNYFNDDGFNYNTYFTKEIKYYLNNSPLYQEFTKLTQAYTGLKYVPICSNYKLYDSSCNLAFINNIVNKPCRKFMKDIERYFKGQNI